MKCIIEHLEPKLYEWCLIEYEHISRIVGKGDLIFTNIKNKRDENKLKKFGTVYDKKFSEMDFEKICILSQYTEKTLTTNDKNKFEYFVFGGILGDKPAKKRTNILINSFKKQKINFEERNLGNRQMPTDAAVYAAKKVLDGATLNELKFIDEIEIEINENESIILPFRFVVDDDKLIINERLVEHLRKRKGF